MFSSKYKTITNSGKQFKVNNSLNDTDLNKLIKIIGSFKNMFIKEFEEFNVTNAGSCFIKTKDNKPIAIGSNKLTRKQNEMLCDKVAELLKIGIIQHSNSEWESNAYVKEKLNGKLELCVNYKKLNEYCEEMDYPYTNLDNEFRCFSESAVFTKIAIKDGFYQIPMNSKDKKKTAFRTELGKFEFNCMPYGLLNSEKTFLKIIQKVIGNDENIMIFNDQLLIHTQDLKSNLELLRKLLKKLRDSNFMIDVEESYFCVYEVAFAGCLISNKGYTIDTEIAHRIRMFPPPKCAAEVNTFIDLITPYDKFIYNFNILLHPIKLLGNKETVFRWNDETEEAFNQMIISFINRPLLSYFSQDGNELQIKIKVYENGYTGILEQKDNNGNWKKIKYCSGYDANNIDENICPCTRKERDAVLTAIEKFSDYFEENYVEIITKHGAFQFMNWFSPRDYSEEGQLYCYLNQIEGYNITFKHDDTSKHENDINCFGGQIIIDQAYFRCMDRLYG